MINNKKINPVLIKLFTIGRKLYYKSLLHYLILKGQKMLEIILHTFLS